MNELRRVTVLRRRLDAGRRRSWRAATAGGLVVVVALSASPTLAAVVVRPGGGPERGIDISAYQHAGGAIAWRALARHGIRFVAIKAAEGTYYTDPYYRSDAQAASTAGLAVLAYTFANPARAGGAATAAFAVRAARYRRDAATPLVVDLENDPYSKSDCYRVGQRRMIAWIAGFARRARALTGSWPIIYTTSAWWQECTGSTSRFKNDPLWLAAYDDGPPAAPSAWSRWSFWQYSEQGYLPGIGWTDLDYFQSASVLTSLRPAPERKARHRQKRRPKHQPKHKKEKREPAQTSKRGKRPKPVTMGRQLSLQIIKHSRKPTRAADKLRR